MAISDFNLVIEIEIESKARSVNIFSLARHEENNVVDNTICMFLRVMEREQLCFDSDTASM